MLVLSTLDAKQLRGSREVDLEVLNKKDSMSDKVDTIPTSATYPKGYRGVSYVGVPCFQCGGPKGKVGANKKYCPGCWTQIK